MHNKNCKCPKKILFIFILTVCFILSVFSQDILELVPSNSKAVFYFKDLAKFYNDLKLVPTTKSLLLEPFNGEMLVSALTQMYLSALKVDYQNFISQLDTNLAFFIQENTENNYAYGFVLGPIKDMNSFSSDLKALLDPIKSSGYEFTTIQKNINNEEYFILIADENVYESSKKGVEQLKEVIEDRSGLYYIVNTSDYQGNGYFYVIDNLLMGKSTGDYDPDFVDKSFVKNPSEYPFFGNLFITSGFIPKDLDAFASLIDNFVDYQIIKNLLTLSSGIEVNADILSINFNDNFSQISENNYIKIKTEANVEDIIPILKENNIEYKKTAQNTLEFYVKDEIVKQNNKKESVKYTYYVWKDDYLFISRDNQKNLQKKMNQKPKLSENTLFKKLSNQIGVGDIAYVFLDITSIFRQYGPGLEDENGLLLSVKNIGERRLEINFVLQ